MSKMQNPTGGHGGELEKAVFGTELPDTVSENICSRQGENAQGGEKNTGKPEPDTGTPGGSRKTLECTYDYRDEAGRLLFQAVRYQNPKDFKQRQPDGNGGWIWNLNRCRLVLFGLPDVITSDEIWFVEGEKDSLNLGELGLTATCNPMGAGKWRKHVQDHAIHQPLKGKRVYVVPDNDSSGIAHARDVCGSLVGYAASVRYIELPGLGPKGDISDFIEDHGPEDAKQLLMDLAANTAEYVAPTPPTMKPTTQPRAPKRTGEAARVKSAVDLVALISETVALRAHGSEMQGLCPLHGDDKTPSLSVNPKKQLWVCFGCGKGGDALDWIMERDGIEFPEAVRVLARKAGITLAPPPVRHRPVEAFNQTDTGNAARLAARYGDVVRYAPGLGWMTYAKGRWEPADRFQLQGYAKEVVREMYSEAAAEPDDTLRKGRAKFAIQCEAAHKLRSMVDLLGSEPGIAVDDSAFDADHNLLNCRNGILDVTTGTLSPHRPAAMLTRMTNASYSPDAKCPRWEQFLIEIMSEPPPLQAVDTTNSEPEPPDVRVAFLKRLLGYSIFGHPKDDVWALLVGRGRNGKGVLMHTMCHVLGDYGRELGSTVFTAKKSENDINVALADLRGARFISASEAPGRGMDPEQLKRFTGRDLNKCRLPYAKRNLEFVTSGLVCFAANQRPKVVDTSDGFWDRVLVLDFKCRFVGKAKDITLEDQLKTERDGILRWLVEGCLEWQNDGLQPPASVRLAVESYRDANDVLADFLATLCDFSTDPECYVTVSAMKEAYADYCGGKRTRGLSSHAFNEQLRNREGVVEGKKWEEVDGKRKQCKVWQGVTLVSHPKAETGAAPSTVPMVPKNTVSGKVPYEGYIEKETGNDENRYHRYQPDSQTPGKTDQKQVPEPITHMQATKKLQVWVCERCQLFLHLEVACNHAAHRTGPCSIFNLTVCPKLLENLS
jgi:P4 family phage/plasmid primase-like protien